MLPEGLKAKLEKEAVREKISFGELVRRALQKYLFIKKDPYAHDTFFSSKTVFESEGPDDNALNHDKYLYEDVDVHHRNVDK